MEMLLIAAIIGVGFALCAVVLECLRRAFALLGEAPRW